MILVTYRIKFMEDSKNFFPYILKIIGLTGRICTERFENSIECNLSSNESISSNNLVKCFLQVNPNHAILQTFVKAPHNFFFNKESHECFEQSL